MNSAQHGPESASDRIVPEEKISGESRIVSAPRIGEKPVEKNGDGKAAEPDLRHHVCIGADCKEPVPKPEPPQSDLRRHICITTPCSCPPGQTLGKGGCVASGGTTTISNNESVQTTCQPGTVWNGFTCVASTACPPGQIWNGAACTPSRHCLAGEIWDGTRCVNPATECASYDARAVPIVSALRRLQSDIQQECSQNPNGQTCSNLQAEQQGEFNRYMALWNEAPAACRTRLAAPGSLI